MLKGLSNLILSFCLLGIIFFGVFMMSLNSPLLTEYLLRLFIKKNFSQYQIKTLDIHHQQFHWPGRLILQDIHIDFNARDKQSIKVSKIVIDQLNTLLGNPKSLDLQFDDINIQFPPWVIHNLDVTAQSSWQGSNSSQFQGALHIMDIEYQGNYIYNLECLFAGNNQRLDFKEVKAKSFDSDLKGNISIEYQPEFSYRMDFKMEHLDIKQLKNLYPDLVSQIDGRAQGTVKILGNKKDLRFFEINISMPQDGKIKASLLKKLMLNVDLPILTERLNNLSKIESMVTLEEAQLMLKTLNSQMLSGLLKMKSRQLNTNFDIPIDIRLDGKLQTLLFQGVRSMQQKEDIW